jgi:hypothetical protein
MLTKEASPRVAHTITFHPNLCPTDEGSISSLHFHFSRRWLFIMFICFFCRDTKETKDQAWKSKAQKLSQNSIPRPEPFAFQAQLAKYCHFVFSLFFMLFNLRASLRVSLRGTKGSHRESRCFLENILFFCLDAPFDFAQGDGNKISSLKIKNFKTISKLRSAARAVRLSGSTRGLLPLRFFVVFFRF